MKKTTLLFALFLAISPITLFALTQNPINAITSGSFVFESVGTKTTKITQSALFTEVNMQISGVVNRVKIKQTFKNNNNIWLSGTYVFPLPDDSAVDSLKMYVGDRVIVGQIKTKEVAKKIYFKAKKAGKKASLVEQKRPNIFISKVANIPPNGEITIEIEYLQQVKVEDSKFSIHLPLVVGDRYIAGKMISTPNPAGLAPNTHLVKDASQITPISNNQVKRPVKISVQLKAGFDAINITTPNHNSQITDTENGKQITIDSTKANKDFVLKWQAANQNPVMGLFSEVVDGDTYFMLMLLPQTKIEHNQPREITFIVDSSGSMGGDSMRQSKRALLLAIKNLKKGDKFNIIDFDDKIDALFMETQNADTTHKKLALQFIQNLEADGGTEIYNAIDYALNYQTDSNQNYLKQMVFITDGQIADEGRIFKKLKDDLNETRFYSIGIGYAPNRYLMRKMAEIGKGAYLNIDDLSTPSNIKNSLDNFFDKLNQVAMSDIEIDKKYQAIQAKSSSKDIFAKESLIAVFLANELPDKIEVFAKYNNQKFHKSIDMKIKTEDKGIATFWARRKIEDFYDKYLYKKSAKLKEIITKVALKAHLVSEFTSLVAVEEKISKPKNAKGVNQNLHKLPKQKVVYVQASNTASSHQIILLLALIFLLFAVIIKRRYKF